MLANSLDRIRWRQFLLARGDRTPRRSVRWSPFTDIFHPPPPSRTLLCCKFTKSLATGTRPVRWTLATSNRHHQIRWSPFTDFSHSFHHSTLTYIFEVFSELTRGESDTDSCNGEPSPSDPMESVCRHIFHPVRNSILCCIFT